MPQMSLVVGSLTKRVALPPAQPHDKCPLLAPHPLPFSLPQPVLVPAFHDFSLCALQQTTCAFSSVSQLSIAGISDFCVCLAYVSLRRSPIIQQTCAANLHFSSLLARSVLPGHVSPRIRLPLTCSLAGSCRTIFAHWTRAQAASTPHFVHMVPHLLHGRSEVRSSAPASSLPCKIRPRPSPTELLIAVPTNLSRTCDACRHTARSRFVPRSPCSLSRVFARPSTMAYIFVAYQASILEAM